jgi:hypothetical protein
MAEEAFTGLRDRLVTLVETDLPAFEAELAGAGAPWTPGATIPPW